VEIAFNGSDYHILKGVLSVVVSDIQPLTPKRRFMSALLGGRQDGRVPVGNPTSVISVEVMDKVGIYFPEAHLDAEMMAELAATSHELLGYDTVTPYFSVQQEAAALGGEVDWGGPNMMPAMRDHPMTPPEKIEISEALLEHPALKVVLDSLTILRKHYGDYVAVCGKVMGPWTLSYHVVGVEPFLMMILDDPDRVRRYLDVLKEMTIMFARAQYQAGADLVTIADHATGDLVSPDTYRDFLIPVHREIIQRVGGPNILHICGQTIDRLEHFITAGFDCFHVESKVDIESACQLVKGRMSLVGNINNPTTLLFGTPEDVRADCIKAVDAGIDMLAAECAIPLTTPLANLRAIAETAEEYRRTK
jgi:[methyl-Co(III) methanol-specific corrinoid protein]:coenzyme M methyltransferase